MRLIKRVKISLFISVQALLCSTAFASGSQWIDLTHAFSEESISWPTADNFILAPDFVGQTKGGYYYRTYNFCGAEHGGTHIDAPAHFAKNGQTTAQLPLDKLMGPAVVVDVSHQALENKDYLISLADLVKWEKQYGKIPTHTIVLFFTGFEQFWPHPKQYLGTDERGDEAIAQLHFPGLDKKAAKWLVEQRHIKAVGIDSASIDYGQSKDFMTHRIFAEKDIPIFENIAHLDKLPPKNNYIVALPMKIAQGSGGPLRIIAKKLPEKPKPTIKTTTKITPATKTTSKSKPTTKTISQTNKTAKKEKKA